MIGAVHKCMDARLALTAGVDMKMASTTEHETLKKQLADGTIPQAVVDEAGRRILRVRFTKGLFDRPYVDENLYQTAFLRPDAVALACEAAAKSCVPFNNERGALPLSKQVKKIALIGPLAEDGGSLPGCWSARGRAEDCVAIASGLRAKLAPGAGLTSVRGGDACDTTNSVQSEIQKAVRAANAADAVILALGEPVDFELKEENRQRPGRGAASGLINN